LGYEEELALRNGWRWIRIANRLLTGNWTVKAVRDFYLSITRQRSIQHHTDSLSESRHYEFCRARRRRSISGGDTRWFEVRATRVNNYIAGWTGGHKRRDSDSSSEPPTEPS